MIDKYGRDISYLRLSVTDRCNLNCIYCAPAMHDKCGLLTADEIEMATRAFCELGISKVRLTGGEPLVRADILDIIRRVSAIPEVRELPMTTNGVRLYELSDQLVEAGVTRLNVSLDSLKPERYAQITGRDAFDKVIRGIEKMRDMGVGIKLNAVLVKGVNDDEIDDFIELTKDNPYAVRFIEMMPIGKYGNENRDKIIYNKDIIAARPYLIRHSEKDDTVSETYIVEGYKGKVGFISPLSHKFCNTCNRVRLTADGKLRICLGSNGEADLAPYIKSGDYEALKEKIYDVIYNKPKGHNFEEGFDSNRDMSRIGG